MEDKLLRLVYTSFLGIILAVFIGLGIATFYESPKVPSYPVQTEAQVNSLKPSMEVSAEQVKYERDYRAYEATAQVYHRNVSIISMVFAVILLIVSFLLERRNSVITNGVMLGGVFVLMYSIGRGIASTDTKYTFIAVSISLAIVIYLGYRRFGAAVKPHVKKSSKKK
jgi:preprotein translocase subunit SecG